MNNHSYLKFFLGIVSALGIGIIMFALYSWKDLSLERYARLMLEIDTMNRGAADSTVSTTAASSEDVLSVSNR